MATLYLHILSNHLCSILGIVVQRYVTCDPSEIIREHFFDNMEPEARTCSVICEENPSCKGTFCRRFVHTTVYTFLETTQKVTGVREQACLRFYKSCFLFVVYTKSGVLFGRQDGTKPYSCLLMRSCKYRPSKDYDYYLSSNST